MTIKIDQHQRKEFELFAQLAGAPDLSHKEFDDIQYNDPVLNNMWAAWLARGEASQELAQFVFHGIKKVIFNAALISIFIFCFWQLIK